MIELFIPIRILDIIDIFLVAFLMYRIYLVIRGTPAVNIFIGLFSIYVFWLIVKSLNMKLISSILGQVIGVGVIALIIVFQQEIRRFLLLIGSQYFSNKQASFRNIMTFNFNTQTGIRIKSIVKACINLSHGKIGGLIVITRKSDLRTYTKTGDIINATTSSRLIESIFNKKSPLHDGAVIIRKDKIAAARCILPISENTYLPPYFGLRHRAALGITEVSDAFVIVVSEERGEISVADNGQITTNINSKELMKILEEKFVDNV